MINSRFNVVYHLLCVCKLIFIPLKKNIMTTREIYFKNLVFCDLPIGLVGYTYKNKNGVIQIGRNVPLELRTDEITVEKSVKIMKDIEKTDGFMFWNNSPEGEEFFNSNWDVIGKSLAGMVLNQK
jgi:hypothetical protein